MFSRTTDHLVSSANLVPTTRDTKSVPPPGGKGINRRIGLLGKSAWDHTEVAQKSANNEKIRRVDFMGIPEKWLQVKQESVGTTRGRLIGLGIIN
jgi:hypothetical protein